LGSGLLQAAPAVALKPEPSQLNVNFQGAVLNVLELVAEDDRVGALGELSSATCYRGSAPAVIAKLNGVFRMFARSEQMRLAQLPVRYISASTGRLGEKTGTIGIHYEDLRDEYRQKRLTIEACTGPGLQPQSDPAPFTGGVFVEGGVNLFSLVSEDERLPVLGTLKASSCYQGDLIQAVQRLNGIFNMADGSERLRSVPIGKRFVQATTPKLDEPRGALGIEYESGAHYTKRRFTILKCL
jgi:hypothetical protein